MPSRYLILERSADLRERQRTHVESALAGTGLAGRVEWLDALPDAGLRGVVLANELLDAANNLQFEKAAHLRDQIQYLKEGATPTTKRPYKRGKKYK